VSVHRQLETVQKDFDALSKQKGPKGDQGLQGIAGIQGLQGKDGEQGKKGGDGEQGKKGEEGDSIKGDDGQSVDIEAIKIAVMAWLNDAGFTVVFEAGDEASEVERTVNVKFNGGELRIPPMILRIRNVNQLGNQVGQPLFDSSPLGLPLKLKFKPPVKASQ